MQLKIKNVGSGSSANPVKIEISKASEGGAPGWIRDDGHPLPPLTPSPGKPGLKCGKEVEVFNKNLNGLKTNWGEKKDRGNERQKESNKAQKNGQVGGGGGGVRGPDPRTCQGLLKPA